MTDTHERRIRSFVKREGRLTPGQQKNLDTLWPRFGLAKGETPIDWDREFGRETRRTLEIGFGAGEVMADLVARHPDEDFIGIEVYRNGVARLMGSLADIEAENARIFCDDAVDVLRSAFADDSLDEVLLYFADPWPKKRHHKRRIVQPAFADDIARVLRPHGIWRLATDWANYAEHMRDVLDGHARFDNIGDHNGFVSTPPRAATRFETRGRRRGHAVFDMAYQVRSGS